MRNEKCGKTVLTGVKTLEFGYRLPKFKRSGWRNCGNY